MTREDAIAIFKGFKFLPREMKAVDMAIKALEQEPKWIPVSERLPQVYEWVLITYNKANEKNSVEIGRINEQGLWQDGEYDYFFRDTVLAWMPLPTPYKPQESDE